MNSQLSKVDMLLKQIDQKCLEQTQRQIVLQNISALNKSNSLTDAQRLFLKTLYSKFSSDKSGFNKAALTVINAIFTQKRVYFSITRESFRKLAKLDKNQKVTGMKSERWSTFIAHLANVYGITTVHTREEGATIFTIPNEWEGSLLLLSPEELETQREEILNFVQKKKKAKVDVKLPFIQRAEEKVRLSVVKDITMVSSEPLVVQKPIAPIDLDAEGAWAETS